MNEEETKEYEFKQEKIQSIKNDIEYYKNKMSKLKIELKQWEKE